MSRPPLIYARDDGAGGLELVVADGGQVNKVFAVTDEAIWLMLPVMIDHLKRRRRPPG